MGIYATTPYLYNLPTIFEYYLPNISAPKIYATCLCYINCLCLVIFYKPIWWLIFILFLSNLIRKLLAPISRRLRILYKRARAQLIYVIQNYKPYKYIWLPPLYYCRFILRHIKLFIRRDTISFIIFIRQYFILPLPYKVRRWLREMCVWLPFFYICKWRKITYWRRYFKFLLYLLTYLFPKDCIKLLINYYTPHPAKLWIRSYITTFLFYYFALKIYITTTTPLYLLLIIF